MKISLLMTIHFGFNYIGKEIYVSSLQALNIWMIINELTTNSI